MGASVMMHRATNRIEKLSGTTRCRLRVIHGPDAGLEVALPAVGVVVGAGIPSDVVLADESVSSRHVSVRPSPTGFDVTDLQSKNGTLIDGASIQKATVPPGTVLRIGNTLLQLLPDEEVVDIEPSRDDSFGALVGSSVAMRQIYALLARASASNAPVLVMGESGTGKELCARAVHEHSPRRGKPFVTFDCGAVSENLIESDLFGHVKGAFTGAVADRPGALEQADGGTLFLDEIGDLPLKLQPKLLRMLEAGEATALGGKKSARYDVRIVAATHRDLREEVAKGNFRGDLYYRLGVVELEMPPLRQRATDLPGLVRHFLKREGVDQEVKPSKNLDRLAAYAWPGNIRELRNVIARAVALSLPGTKFEDMPIVLGPATVRTPETKAIRADRPYHDAKAELLANFDTEYVKDLLVRAGGNLSQAARMAGVERRHLYRLLERIGHVPEGRKLDDKDDEKDESDPP
ncbi:MAG: sigma 54-interacting transcriptional regulator [Polyangiaceae bacterium]